MLTQMSSAIASGMDGWQVAVPADMDALVVGPDNAPRVMHCVVDEQKVIRYTSSGDMDFTIGQVPSRLVDFGCGNYTAFGDSEFSSSISDDGRTIAIARTSNATYDSSLVRLYDASGLLIWEYLAEDECGQPAKITSRPVISEDVATYIYESCQGDGYRPDYVIVGLNIDTHQVIYSENLGQIDNATTLSWYAGGVVFSTNSDLRYIPSVSTSNASQSLGVSWQQQIVQDVDGTAVYKTYDNDDASKCYITFQSLLGGIVDRPLNCEESQHSAATMPNGDFAALAYLYFNGVTAKVVHKNGNPDTVIRVPTPIAAEEDSFIPMRLLVDANGKIVIMSDYTEKILQESRPFTRWINRTVIDIFSQGGTHESRWSSDAIDDQTISVDNHTGIALANGAIYLLDRYGDRLIKITAPGISLAYRDSMRWDTSGVPIDRLKYVAMGDSYSSGEGVEPYIDGTDDDPSNTCHRSAKAYPMLLGSYISSPVDVQHFVACSGAELRHTIEEVNESNMEPPQAAFITPNTDIVSISIGGNDVDFGLVLGQCTTFDDPDKDSHTPSQEHAVEEANCLSHIADATAKIDAPAFQVELTNVFEGIKNIGDAYGNPGMKLVVVGYPQLYPEFNDIQDTCTWGPWGAAASGAVSGRDISSDEVTHLRAATKKLNTLLSDIIADMNDSDVSFVNPQTAFSSHELCTAVPYILPVVPDAFDPIGRRASFHPNQLGQKAYADIVAKKISVMLQ